MAQDGEPSFVQSIKNKVSNAVEPFQFHGSYASFIFFRAHCNPGNVICATYQFTSLSFSNTKADFDSRMKQATGLVCVDFYGIVILFMKKAISK